MIFLHTLGRLGLEDSGRVISGAGVQKSRLVLLAVLAASHERGISRDSLLAILWPESDTESARGALKQALYALRRDLGAADLTSGSSELKLNPSVIDSDVARFLDAMEEGNYERAVGLYGGSFLEGIHLPSAEFEQWLASQRSHLTERYRDALEKLARSAEAQGDSAAAVRWWKALASADPLSAAVARSLMQALVRLGDGPAALAHARAHELLVRSELDSPPDSTVLELVEAIRRRSRMPSSANEEPRPASPAELVPKSSSALKGRRFPARRLGWIGAGAGLVILGFGAVSLLGRPAELDQNSVVLIGAHGANPTTALDSLVMVGLAAGTVARDSTLTVLVGPVRVQSSAEGPSSRTRSRARYEVVIHSQPRGDSLLLTSDVTDAGTGIPLGPIEPVEVMTPERDLGITMLGARISIALESRRNPAFASWGHLAALPTNWESFEELELGIRALNTGDPIPHFQRAVALDSTSATPLVWAAFVLTHEGGTRSDSVVGILDHNPRRMRPWDRALLAVVRARNSGDKAGAHAAGHALLDLVGYRSEWAFVLAWDLVGLSRFREALELLKRVPDLRWAMGWGPAVVARDLAHHNLGDYQGELEAARRELARDPDNRFYVQMEVKALAPLGKIREIEQRLDRAFTLKAGVYRFQPFDQAVVELQGHGRLEEARSIAQRWLRALEADSSRTLDELALDRAGVYYAVLDWANAERALRPLPESHPEFLSYLGTLALIQAWRGDRTALAETEQRILRIQRKAALDPLDAAQYAALLGDRETAVALLARAFREGLTIRYTLHWEPAFASLRGYPPFEALYEPVDDPVHLREVLRK